MDWTSIPATPDVLLEDYDGLGIFLRNGKNKGPILPCHQVGQPRGRPAVMNLARAREMFPAVEPSDEGGEAKPKSDGQESVEDRMARVDLEEAMPQTEEEWRRRYSPPTVPLQTPEEQWALFSSRKHMADVSLLASQYIKLVTAKVKAEEKARDEKAKADKKARAENAKADTKAPVADAETSDAPTVDTKADDAAASSEWPKDKRGWPVVEGLDWNGFANWVYRCRQVDPNFRKQTCGKWLKQNNDRLKLADELSKWTAPPGFDDGSSTQSIRKFFPNDNISVDPKK